MKMSMNKYFLTGYQPPVSIQSRADVKRVQIGLGVKADGIWGPETERAYSKSRGAPDYNPVKSTQVYRGPSALAGASQPSVQKPLAQSTPDVKMSTSTNWVSAAAKQAPLLPHMQKTMAAFAKDPFAAGPLTLISEQASVAYRLQMIFPARKICAKRRGRRCGGIQN